MARRLQVLAVVIIRALASPPRDLLEGLFLEWSAEDRKSFVAESAGRAATERAALKRLDLWRVVSPDERAFLKDDAVTMTAKQQIRFTWRIECAQVLLWALYRMPELPSYDEMASHDLLKDVRMDADFAKRAQLRGKEELESARQASETWHWRARTKQLIDEGRSFPQSAEWKRAGLTSFDDVVRWSASHALVSGLISETIDEDFPALGKAYRDLSAAEFAQVGGIAVERHFALNWLCGKAPRNRWDETPTGT